MDEPELKVIDVFICKMRKRLANASQGKIYIETVWGRGYALREGAPEHRNALAAVRAVGKTFRKPFTPGRSRDWNGADLLHVADVVQDGDEAVGEQGTMGTPS